MQLARSALFCLFSASFVACATAQDSGPAGVGATGAGANSAAGSSGRSSSGGTSSVAGSNGAFGGSGALPGTSGSSSVAGQGGSVSSAGAGGRGSGGSSNGGAAGTAGSAGAGGSAPVFEAGECAASPALSLSYKQSATGQQITGQYEVTNLGDTAVPLASLTIRYFFTNKHTKGWNNSIYDSKIDGGSGGYRKVPAMLAEAPINPALDGADTYAQVSFTGTDALEKNAKLTISWDMQPIGYDAPFQVQSNDYSFNAAATVLTPWDHIAVYEGSTLAFGCLPKALSTGMGGAGGTSGAGGTGAAGASGSGTGGSAGSNTAGTGGSGGGAGSSSIGGSSGTGGLSGAGGVTSAGSGGAGSGGTSSGGTATAGSAGSL